MPAWNQVRTGVLASHPEAAASLMPSLEALGLAARVETAGIGESPLPFELLVWILDEGQRVARAPTLPPGAQCVALVPPSFGLEQMAALLGRPECSHVLRGSPERLGERLTVTLRKLCSGELFGLEPYLGVGAEAEQRIRLVDYSGRREALEAVEAQAARAGFRRPVRRSIAGVCEELLMNALYSAPVTDEGRPLYADLSPRRRLALASPRPVTLRFSAGEEAFALGVRDRYGTLSKARVVGYLERCLEGPQIEGKSLGAGLGLYTAASRTRELVLNLAPGQLTEVIACFSRSVRQSRAPATFSIFVQPPPAEA